MKRKISALFLFSFIIMLFAGCFSFIPEMTPEEEMQITQATADLILEFDSNYSKSYLSDDELNVALEKEKLKREKDAMIREEESRIELEKEQANTPDDIEVEENSNANTGSLGEMNQYIGCEELVILYNGYKVCQQYPDEEEGTYFKMTPSEEAEFLVLDFSLLNESETICNIDIVNDSTYFMLDINGVLHRRALTTLFFDDLSVLDEDIEPQTEKKVFLLFEKPIDFTVETMELIISSENRDIYKKIPLQ